MGDYEDRSYLSAIEVAKYLGVSVKDVHRLLKTGEIAAVKSPSGQYRFTLSGAKELKEAKCSDGDEEKTETAPINIQTKETKQSIYIDNAQNMSQLEDDSVHLVITSPPYFNTKMYSGKNKEGDLGNIHVLDEWYDKIKEVWQEVYRVLQPGRKFFLNIMNLPIKDKSSYRSLNLVGRSIDLCEEIGFIFKRDIIWHKTNGVRAHFGTYPYPGGILLNNMHEFIVEFNKPERPGFKKYNHITSESRERSRLEKDFWLEIKKSDVWLMKPEKSGDGRKHIAPFPRELPGRIIKAYSFIGETVLDPFLGAGTTLLEAARLHRNGMGFEINPDIAATAVDLLLDEVKEIDKDF